jgi:NADPH-dependent ferric siderophore reductase
MAVQHERRPFPLCTGVAVVQRVRPLTPHMARITLGGADFSTFGVQEPGEIVTLLWPAEGRALVLPQVGWRFPPGVADAQHARNYTVRRFDADRGEVDVDFVLHGDAGRASAWAARAQPGDRIGFAGPRVHWTGDGDVGWTLLVADETGLPALAAILETLPDGHPTVALVEIADAAERQPLPTRAGLTLHWLLREGDAVGTHPRLADAVRALDLPPDAAVTGRVWGAGEAGSMRLVRHHVRAERGLPAESVSVLGYWKHRQTPEWD